MTDFGEWPVWLRDGRQLLFSNHGSLFLIDTTRKQWREILTLPQRTLGSVSLSPDNRTIYFTFMVAESDLWTMNRSETPAPPIP